MLSHMSFPCNFAILQSEQKNGFSLTTVNSNISTTNRSHPKDKNLFFVTLSMTFHFYGSIASATIFVLFSRFLDNSTQIST